MTRSTVTPRSVFASILCFVILAVTGSTTQAADLPSAEEVLERFVEAVGGRDALENLEVRHYRGKIVQDLTWKDPQHQETPFVAEAYADGRVCYAESESWAHLPGLDNGEPRRKLRWLMHPRFALVVDEFYPGLRASRRAVRDGRPVIVLEPAELPSEHYGLYFDEQTGLLAHVGYHNDVEGWRPVDGILFPSRWVFGRKGGHTTYVFEQVAPGPAPTDP